MHAGYSRVDRVADQIQKDLAIAVQRELKDPRLGMVTISDVEVSKDFSYADVFFTVFPEDRAEQTALLLSNSSAFLRKWLGRAMKTRTTPKLRFHFDDSLVTGSRIDRALRESRPIIEQE